MRTNYSTLTAIDLQVYAELLLQKQRVYDMVCRSSLGPWRSITDLRPPAPPCYVLRP